MAVSLGLGYNLSYELLDVQADILVLVVVASQPEPVGSLVLSRKGFDWLLGGTEVMRVAGSGLACRRRGERHQDRGAAARISHAWIIYLVWYDLLYMLVMTRKCCSWQRLTFEK